MGDSLFQNSGNKSDGDYDCFIRLLALGDSNVGKTSILFRYTDSGFDERFSSTVGVDFRHKYVNYQNKDADGLLGPSQRLYVQMWDTAGQERFRSLCTVFLRDAMGFLLVFDLTNEKSFQNCRDWMELLCQHSYCDRPDVVLVGNKDDLTAERQVPFIAAMAMAKGMNVPYIETSAKTGYNINNAVDRLLDLVMARIEASVYPLPPKNTADLQNQPKKKACC